MLAHISSIFSKKNIKSVAQKQGVRERNLYRTSTLEVLYGKTRRPAGKYPARRATDCGGNAKKHRKETGYRAEGALI